MFDQDQFSQTVSTLTVETTRSVASGLSMPHKKETMLMLVNSLHTIFVSSADILKVCI